VCLYVIIILLHDLTLLRCKTCAIDIGSLKATYLLTYLLYVWFLCRVFMVGGSNGAISGYIKSSWHQAAMLDNFEWPNL